MFAKTLSFLYLCELGKPINKLCNFFEQMKIRGFIALIIIALCAVSCSSTRVSRVSFRSLDVATFEKVISREDVWVVDVRTPAEHEKGCIEGTDQNLNVKGDKFFTEYKSLPQDKLIALYCKGGGRSKQVAGVLAGNGYRVVELAVGYDGWVKAKEDKE